MIGIYNYEHKERVGGDLHIIIITLCTQCHCSSWVINFGE